MRHWEGCSPPTCGLVATLGMFIPARWRLAVPYSGSCSAGTCHSPPLPAPHPAAASLRGWARTAAATSRSGCWASCTRACSAAAALSATGAHSSVSDCSALHWRGPHCCRQFSSRVPQQCVGGCPWLPSLGSGSLLASCVARPNYQLQDRGAPELLAGAAQHPHPPAGLKGGAVGSGLATDCLHSQARGGWRQPRVGAASGLRAGVLQPVGPALHA